MLNSVTSHDNIRSLRDNNESESEASSAASTSKESSREVINHNIKIDNINYYEDKKISVPLNNSMISPIIDQNLQIHSFREVYDPSMDKLKMVSHMKQHQDIRTSLSNNSLLTDSNKDLINNNPNLPNKRSPNTTITSQKYRNLQTAVITTSNGDWHTDAFDINDDSNSMAVELSSVDSCAVNDFKGCDISLQTTNQTINMAAAQNNSHQNSSGGSSSTAIEQTANKQKTTANISTNDNNSQYFNKYHDNNGNMDLSSNLNIESKHMSNNNNTIPSMQTDFKMAISSSDNNNNINNSSNNSSNSCGSSKGITTRALYEPVPALFIAPSTLDRDAISVRTSTVFTYSLADATRASDWLQKASQQQTQFGSTSHHHHHGHNSHSVKNSSAIDSIFGLTPAVSIDHGSTMGDSVDSESSIATSLFVEVASLDEHGTYQRYGAACDEDLDEYYDENNNNNNNNYDHQNMNPNDADPNRSTWTQYCGYDSDLTMRSYPHSLTHSLHKYNDNNNTNNTEFHKNRHGLDQDLNILVDGGGILHGGGGVDVNGSIKNPRRFRHRLKSIKSLTHSISNKDCGLQGIIFNGKRKRSTNGSNNSVTGTSVGENSTTYCDNTNDNAAIGSSSSTQPIRASKYRGIMDSDIRIRKSVEFGKVNHQLYRYIDKHGTLRTGVYSTSTSINNGTGSIDGTAIDVEDGYDGASERGRCEDETDYPVDDDVASGSDNELPLGSDEVELGPEVEFEVLLSDDGIIPNNHLLDINNNTNNTSYNSNNSNNNSCNILDNNNNKINYNNITNNNTLNRRNNNTNRRKRLDRNNENQYMDK